MIGEKLNKENRTFAFVIVFWKDIHVASNLLSNLGNTKIPIMSTLCIIVLIEVLFATQI